MRPRIYKSPGRRFLAGVVYSVGGALGVLALLFTYFEPNGLHNEFLLAMLVVPPIWVVVEYLFLFDNWEDERAVRELKCGYRIATVMWLVIVVLLAMGPGVWW